MLHMKTLRPRDEQTSLQSPEPRSGQLCCLQSSDPESIECPCALARLTEFTLQKQTSPQPTTAKVGLTHASFTCLKIFKYYVHVRVYSHKHLSAVICGGQKRTLKPLELEVQTVGSCPRGH